MWGLRTFLALTGGRSPSHTDSRTSVSTLAVEVSTEIRTGTVVVPEGVRTSGPSPGVGGVVVSFPAPVAVVHCHSRFLPKRPGGPIRPRPDIERHPRSPSLFLAPSKS